MSLRLLMLPIKRIHAAFPKKGVIYDIGCGQGDLSEYLAHASTQRQLFGIDINKQKISNAKKKTKKSNLVFVYGDALQFSYRPCKGVVLSDFLHHISYENQERLLKKVADKIQKNGALVIKEVDKSDTIRMMLTRLWDFILYPKDKIFFRSKSEWKKKLEKYGFSVSASSEVLWFPGSTTLFVCTKS